MNDGGPRLTLAIEISNPSGGGEAAVGVALGMMTPGIATTTTLTASETLREVDRDRDDLIPAIERLLIAAGKRINDIRAVAVSVGPGGFTSTRVACASAAMLAEGLGIPGVAVPTALVAVVNLATLEPHRPRGKIAVLLASKGAAAWCAVIDTDAPDNTWCASARAGAMITAEQVAALRPSLLLADHHLPATLRQVLIESDLRIGVLGLSAHACLRAAALCPMVDPSALVPIYPREPEAVTLWRQRHGDSRPAGPLADSHGR